MISRDAINNAWERFRSSLSIHDREQARDLKELADGLIEERDAALQENAELKLRIQDLLNTMREREDG